MDPLIYVLAGFVGLLIALLLGWKLFGEQILSWLETRDDKRSRPAPPTVDRRALREYEGRGLEQLVAACATLVVQGAWLTDRLRNGPASARKMALLPLPSEKQLGEQSREVAASGDERRQAYFIGLAAKLLEDQLLRLEARSFDRLGEPMLQLACAAADTSLVPRATLPDAPAVETIQARLGAIHLRIGALALQFELVVGTDF